jgi:hypothetical protein
MFARMLYIAVSAPGEGPHASEDVLHAARRVGELLAAEGAVVLCGGLGGAMAAVAGGVRAGGGVCVGLLPGSDRSQAAGELSLALATGLGQARNAVLVNAADAVIALGESPGTLSEIGHALRGERPVVTLSGWQIDGTRAADNPADAVRLALSLAAG